MEELSRTDAEADFETLAEIQQNFAAFEKALPIILRFIQDEATEE